MILETLIKGINEQKMKNAVNIDSPIVQPKTGSTDVSAGKNILNNGLLTVRVVMQRRLRCLRGGRGGCHLL